MRFLALTAGLCIFLGPLAADGADEAPKRAQKGKGFGRFGGNQALFAPGAVDKLKLSTEQKDKVEKLVKEFEEKAKDATAKAREAMQKAIQDQNRDAIKTAVTEMREKAEKVRDDYLGKVGAVLTDEQKKTLEEIKKERPQAPQFQPFNRPGQGGQGGARGTGAVLPAELQEQLKLSTEQKEKIAKLQKEIEGKINEVLNEEQKKKLEELKKGGARRRPGAQKSL